MCQKCACAAGIVQIVALKPMEIHTRLSSTLSIFGIVGLRSLATGLISKNIVPQISKIEENHPSRNIWPFDKLTDNIGNNFSKHTFGNVFD